MITIVTPTFNRSDRLESLYCSLCEQTSRDFIWLVVDDGSSDNTRDLVYDWIDAGLFEIVYIYKSNGGKHSALNRAFELISTAWFIVVDSDDILVENAVESFLILILTCKVDVVAISLLRGDLSGRAIGRLYPEAGLSNYIDRYSRGGFGDKADLIKSSALEGFCFPEYPNENFMAEAPLFIFISNKGRIIFRNDILYLTEYLDGGLSSNSLVNRYRCKYSSGYVYKCLYSALPVCVEKIKAGINWWRFFGCHFSYSRSSVPFLLFFPAVFLRYLDKLRGVKVG